MKRFALAAALLSVFYFPPLAAQPSPSLQNPAIEELAAFAFPETAKLDLPEPISVEVFKNRIPDDISGEQLFMHLHKSLNASARVPVPGYTQAKAYMYSKADNIRCNGAAGIITFYSQVCVNGTSSNGNDYSEKKDLNGDGIVDKIVNAEHIWPQGYFNSLSPMVSDLHQLAPTFETTNSRRGNLRFAKVSRPVYSTLSGSKQGDEGFEPADAVKGNVARAMLYFVVRYYDKSIRRGMDYDDFWILRVPMFLEWNRVDPPDANELRRNGLVEAFQGNRNPFVDNPALADRVGAAVFASH